MSTYREQLGVARKRDRNKWRRWAKRQMTKRMRRAVRHDPQAAPTKRAFYGYES